MYEVYYMKNQDVENLVEPEALRIECFQEGHCILLFNFIEIKSNQVIKLVTGADGMFELLWIRVSSYSSNTAATSFINEIAIDRASSEPDVYFVAKTNSYGYDPHGTQFINESFLSGLIGSSRSSDC